MSYEFFSLFKHAQHIRQCILDNFFFPLLTTSRLPFSLFSLLLKSYSLDEVTAVILSFLQRKGRKEKRKGEQTGSEGNEQEFQRVSSEIAIQLLVLHTHTPSLYHEIFSFSLFLSLYVSIDYPVTIGICVPRVW